MADYMPKEKMDSAKILGKDFAWKKDDEVAWCENYKCGYR